jgi:hypothetical protein
MLAYAPLILLGTYFYDILAYQFTRGKGELDYSSRIGGAAIWAYYVEFIKDNLLWGNASSRLWHGEFHAHNSWLQVIGTHGITLASSYFFFIVKNINRVNLPYVLPILIYSCAQYGFGWGVSLMDIFLFTFLACGHTQYVKR